MNIDSVARRGLYVPNVENSRAGPRRARLAPARGLGEGAGEARSALEGQYLYAVPVESIEEPAGDGRSRMRPSLCTRLNRRSALSKLSVIPEAETEKWATPEAR